MIAQHRGGNEEGEATGDADEGLIGREETSALSGGDEGRDPGEPGAAGDSAEEIENEEQKKNERELGLRLEESHARNERNGENEDDTATPAGVDEFFVADAADVIGGGNLKNNQQGKHAGDDAENGCGGAEVLGVEDHGAAEDDLERKRVERGEQEGVVQPGRKLLSGAIQSEIAVALRGEGGNGRESD